MNMMLFTVLSSMLGAANTPVFVIPQDRLIFAFGGAILAVLFWTSQQLLSVNAKVNRIDRKLAIIETQLHAQANKDNGDSET